MYLLKFSSTDSSTESVVLIDAVALDPTPQHRHYAGDESATTRPYLFLASFLSTSAHFLSDSGLAMLVDGRSKEAVHLLTQGWGLGIRAQGPGLAVGGGGGFCRGHGRWESRT